MKEFKGFDFNSHFQNVSDGDVRKSIGKNELGCLDFLNLLSPKAASHLEAMAQKARELTIQHFGRTIQLYIPLYISNYCSNECIYCGFSKKNRILRKKLSLEEIEKEAQEIEKTGIRHILVLTGEASGITPLDYIENTVRLLRKRFSSVAIEMFPMEVDEYRRLKHAGADCLTIYQEVYDEEIYKKVHISGKKTDYRYRLDTPERGAAAGFRAINIGALFGLGDVRKEAFFSGMHAKYLQDKYLDTEISLSLPRINKAEGGFRPYHEMDDRSFVQTMLAYRLFLPRVGINVSTRESSVFRDNLVGLGVTRISAGSRTTVGGYSQDTRLGTQDATAQFDIHDCRSVSEIVGMIGSKGFQPVFKDWDEI